MTLQLLIEYILDPAWVTEHCLDGLVGGNSFFKSYNDSVAMSCCAPNLYLYENKDLLLDEEGKCLLLELFQQNPSVNAMKLLDKSLEIDPSFASAVLHKSMIDTKGRPNESYISYISKFLSKDYPSLSGVIIKEVANCSGCIKEVRLSKIASLVSWLYETLVPNETLFILSKRFVNEDSNSDYVVSISSALSDPRFASARLKSEEDFLLSISEGMLFKPKVFTNFEASVLYGRVTRETIGFLAYATKYELYTPPRDLAVEWFKFLLQDSIKLLSRDDISQKDKEESQEEQASLALDALTRLIILELDSAKSDLTYISEIIQYIIDNEYKFLQTKYRLRIALHKLVSVSEKASDKAEFIKIINKILDHDETVPEFLLIKLNLTRTVSKNLPKNKEALLKETLSLNEHNPTIDQAYLPGLLKDIGLKMQEIKDKNQELSLDNHRRIVINLRNKKPGEIKPNEIHVYNRDGKIFIRKFDEDGMLVDFDATELLGEEAEDFRWILSGYEDLQRNSEETICRIANCTLAWSDEQFKVWVSGLKVIDDSNIAEVVAVLAYAYHLTVFGEKFFIRDHQLIAILLMFKHPNGLILEVETGGGKSAIIAIGNAIEGLMGLIGHTISVSTTLVSRDTEDQKPFFDKLGLSLDHNTLNDGSRPNKCYSARRVYCDIRHLLGDNLRNLHEYVMEVSDVDTVTLDEIDFLLLDQSVVRSMKIQLSDHIPGFSYIKPLLQLLRAELYYTRVAPVMKGYEYDEANDMWMSPNVTEYRSFTTEEMISHIKAIVESYIRETISNSSHLVPFHLRSFIDRHIERWVGSSLKAEQYQQGIEYIAYNSSLAHKPARIIAPVNLDTGAIQESLVLTDALTQLLQIKEGLVQTSESLTTIFTSYLGYFLRQKRLFGLTGTVGKEWHQKFIYEVYGTPSIILPKFMESRMSYKGMSFARSEEDWLNRIINEANKALDESRASLIIAETINDVALIIKALKQAGYKGSIYEYYDGQKHKSVVKRRLRPGDVIVATNAAGRGTDIQIARLVEHNGGLHVILTSFAESLRCFLQGLGRGARNGESGTGIAIINEEKYAEFMEQCRYDTGGLVKSILQRLFYSQDEDRAIELTKCFNGLRDEKEISRLNELRICSIPGKKLEDWLFQEHVRNIRINTSPTGLELIIKPGNSTESDLINQTEGQLYLYSSVEDSSWIWKKQGAPKVYLKSKSSTAIDITDLLSKIDQKTLAHINTVLSRPGMSLNGRGYELVHFIAAYNVLSKRSDIIARVIASYERQWGGDIGCNGPIEDLVETERIFLESLANKTVVNGTCPSKEDLELEKFKDLFRVWNEDRRTYNSKQDIQEYNQKFGMFYKEHLHLMLTHPDCNVNDPEGESARDAERDFELREKAEKFFKSLSGSSITNPAYLLHKAFAYEQIDASQAWLSGDGSIAIRGSYGFFPKKDDERGIFRKAAQSLVKAFNWMTGAEVFQSLMAGSIPVSKVYITNALSEAHGYSQTASTLDPFYNWCGHNALSYFGLRLDGNIFEIEDQDDARRAGDVMKSFAIHQNQAAQGISRYVELLDGYLHNMLITGFVKRRSEFAIQKKAEIEFYRGVAQAMMRNVDKVRNVLDGFEDNPSMTYIKDVIIGEGLLGFVNRTAIIEFYNSTDTDAKEFNETDFDISDIINFNITDEQLANITINATKGNQTGRRLAVNIT